MSKKQVNKKIIEGIDIYQRALLEVDPSTERFIYKLTPGDVFDEDLGTPPISKLEYVSLYESWSDADKDQLNILTSFLEKDILVKCKLGKDDVGEFGEFYVETHSEKYVVKIYGPPDFLNYFSLRYIDGTLFKPGFTIKSLYTGALKQD